MLCQCVHGLLRWSILFLDFATWSCSSLSQQPFLLSVSKATHCGRSHSGTSKQWKVACQCWAARGSTGKEPCHVGTTWQSSSVPPQQVAWLNYTPNSQNVIDEFRKHMNSKSMNSWVSWIHILLNSEVLEFIHAFIYEFIKIIEFIYEFKKIYEFIYEFIGHQLFLTIWIRGFFLN